MESQNRFVAQTVNEAVNQQADRKLAIELELDQRAEAIKYVKKILRSQAIPVTAALITQGFTAWSEDIVLLLEDSRQREVLRLEGGMLEELEELGTDESSVAIAQNTISNSLFTEEEVGVGITNSFIDGLKDTFKKYGCINNPDIDDRQRARKKRQLAAALIEAQDDLVDSFDCLSEIVAEIEQSPFADHAAFNSPLWRALKGDALLNKSQLLFSSACSDNQIASALSAEGAADDSTITLESKPAQD
jgi:hypothetical protein